jgi:hypothetical protein
MSYYTPQNINHLHAERARAAVQEREVQLYKQLRREERKAARVTLRAEHRAQALTTAPARRANPISSLLHWRARSI